MKTITKIYVAMAITSLSASALAGDVLRGAAIGAGGGAVAGAVLPGMSVGEGALIGGAGGAVVGALDKDRGRHHYRWYRDHHGREYRIRNGHRVYRRY